MGISSQLRSRAPYALALTLLLSLLALAACNSSGTAGSVPGVSNDTITIGSVLDTTGILKTICAPILAGDQLYFNKINAAGGVNGRKIKVIQVRDNGDSTKTKDGVRQLFEQDRAFALFQVCGSGDSNVAESYVDANGIPFEDPIGGVAAYQDAQGHALPWTWMTQPNYYDEGHVLGYYAANTLHAKTVGLLYEDDVLGLQQKTALSESLR